MTDLSDVVAVWQRTAEAYKARCEQLEGEVSRLKAQGTGPQSDAQALPPDIDAVIVRYSFGDPTSMAANRTFARTQLAAGAKAGDVAEVIRRGAVYAEE